MRRAKCIVDQYSARYNEQTGLNLKGKQNQGENIADNGGIKEAYMGYGKIHNLLVSYENNWISEHELLFQLNGCLKTRWSRHCRALSR